MGRLLCVVAAVVDSPQPRIGVDFTCTSRVSGVTCTNRAGHGLFVARESWREL